MKSIKNKREINGAVWFFLAISMFATASGAFSNFLNYYYFIQIGIGSNPSINLIEAIIDILLLVAGIVTFQKSRYGLSALLVLFIVRVFATVPWGGDISPAYILGGKMVYLLRDAGPFSIALFFHKNGISGWQAFFASDEWIELHTKKGSNSKRHESITSKDISDVLVPPTNVIEKKTLENTEIPATDSTKAANPSSPTPGKKKCQYKFKWWHCAAAALSFVVLSLFYLIVKPYPYYLTSFTEKWNYTFKRPNNSVAKRLFDEAMTHHPLHGFAIQRNGKVEFLLPGDLYREKDLYMDIPIYSTTGERISSKDEIVDTCLYLHHIPNRGNYTFAIISGEKLIDKYDSFEARGFNVNDLIVPFNLKKEYTKERELMEIVTNIPTTDADLAQEIYDYYLVYNNKTLLQDYFDKNFKYNKNNCAFLYVYTDVLLYSEQPEKAEEVSNLLLKKNDKDTKALTTMANTSSIKDNWEDAEKYARKAVDYGTENPDAYFILAEALYKKGGKTEAQRMFNVGCEKGYSTLESKFREAGGCPFEVKSIEFAFTNYDGKIITDFGKKLYSSKSQYITPRLHVKLKRDLSLSDCLQCKLYRNGHLEQSDNSPYGYTYKWENSTIAPKGMEIQLEIGGWGSSYSGAWPSGNYEFEVYFNNELIGKESFYIY